MNKRERAIEAISEELRKKRGEKFTERTQCEFFMVDVFHEKVQQSRLGADVFRSLQQAIKMGGELDPSLAEPVALAMKEWALEKGCTHFCHWFQPLTDLTAEKHDSFFLPVDGGSAVAAFDGKMLTRGESDASSFPSGGLRTTFEARGYTAWDPSSPAFIIGRTLVIPCIFISWNGDALDKKIPLLRSMEALNQQALRLLRLFGDTKTQRVFPTVGAEQEYFLIDQHFYHLRPDLMNCGRTLFGAKPAKGQELEDHYLGAIPERILAVMEETEYCLMRLGIPVKTRHNEVAPSQYELALTHQMAHIAADHQMILMEVLKKVAARHGFACLLHEKPFAGINGSGKHNNWSLATDQGHNLLEPGATPHENAQFLTFCAAILRAVHKYAKILRASIATAGNDHRLGQHEAPPAILSIFLGDQLHEIFCQLAKKPVQGKKRKEELHVGVAMLPKIPCHSSDRNRTSPFAFTGNKFEFRAVGSSENIAKCNTILNTIMAESLDHIASLLEKGEGDFNKRLETVLEGVAEESLPILFEGDNYNAAWVKEAEKRGLPHLTNTVDALLQYTSADSIALFTKYKVFSRRELESRKEIALTKYVKKIVIEAKSASSIVHTMVLPAVLRHVQQVGEALAFLHKGDEEFLKGVVKEVSHLRKALKELDEELHKMSLEDPFEYPVFARDKLLPALLNLRAPVDKLEGLVNDSLWPLPKYQEMLFIR